jgi:hypothetical protein
MGKQTSDNCFGTEGFECFLIMSGYSDVVHMVALYGRWRKNSELSCKT